MDWQAFGGVCVCGCVCVCVCVCERVWHLALRPPEGGKDQKR